jgi:hypothetical protein
MRIRFNMRPIFAMVALGLALSTVACVPVASPTVTVAPPPETVTVTPPPLTVTVTPVPTDTPPADGFLSYTAEHLYDDYRANPRLADIFTGRLLRVQGNIYQYYPLGNQYIVMLGVGGTHRVDCVFDISAAPDERTLSTGRLVQIEGYGAGKSADGDPKLINCKLIP